ncbi:wax ester/triacylglycerol synthase domain-containing protein [Mycobacterium sp. NPDC048908]|uniref:wax ester/triacylglycerol synthase domain-containing protein n=1 Tax=Mycobacterium sp. NPDC048908 TaxID=3364292 RepID=UPI00371D9DA1
MTVFLSNSDAFIWSIESDPRLRSTIVTLVLLDRSPDWTTLLNRFELLSRTVPMFRQRVVPTAFPTPPRWNIDPDFDLAFHLRRVIAPAPANLDTLLEMARVAAMADFDRARPLWEATLIEGLSDGGAALLCKVNHALTDGIGAVQLAMTLYDRTERSDERQLPNAPAPVAMRPMAGIRDMLAYAAGLTTPLGAMPAFVARGVRHPVGTLTNAGLAAGSILRTARPIRRPGSPIMRERTKIRRLGVHHVPKEVLHRAGKIAGGSLNDAFIAGVAGGLRRYHDKHGAAVDDLVVTMPISIRTAADPIGGNRATLMRFDVPAGVADPAHRIRLIHDRTSRQRSEKSLAYTQFIAGALNLAPRWYVGSALRNVDFVASDVPGLPTPVYLAGAKVRMQYAFSPTIGAALNVTLLSYVDTCALGINADAGAIPDFDVFYDCLVAGFDDVLRLAT